MGVYFNGINVGPYFPHICPDIGPNLSKRLSVFTPSPFYLLVGKRVVCNERKRSKALSKTLKPSRGSGFAWLFEVVLRWLCQWGRESGPKRATEGEKGAFFHRLPPPISWRKSHLLNIKHSDGRLGRLELFIACNLGIEPLLQKIGPYTYPLWSGTPVSDPSRFPHWTKPFTPEISHLLWINQESTSRRTILLIVFPTTPWSAEVIPVKLRFYPHFFAPIFNFHQVHLSILSSIRPHQAND